MITRTFQKRTFEVGKLPEWVDFPFENLVPLDVFRTVDDGVPSEQEWMVDTAPWHDESLDCEGPNVLYARRYDPGKKFEIKKTV